MTQNFLSVATAIEKAKIASTVPFLMALDIRVYDPGAPDTLIETLRVVNNAVPITWMGATYSAASFDLQLKSETGTQSQVSLVIKDVTRAIQARMQVYGGGIGFKVTVTVLNSGRLDQPAEAQESFEVVGASASDYVTTFNLGAENALAKNFPRRMQTRDFCQWRYKSAECGYSGPLTTCDLTLKGANGCKQHQNTIFFGGFPGLNANGRSYR
jgi:phage-related protein